MNIWVPKIKIVENTKEAIELPGSRIEGFYDVTVKYPNGAEEHRSFKNLITDYGLDRWGVGTPITYCSIGNGVGTPSNANSTLFGYLRYTGNTTSGIQGLKYTQDPFYGYVAATFDFGANNTGSAISFNNVGVGPSTGGIYLWSHSQVLTEAGLPTTQSWPNGAQLTIAYRANVYPWLTDGSFTNVTIGSSTYSGVIRPADIANQLNGAFRLGEQKLGSTAEIPDVRAYTGTIGAMTGSPSGSYTQSTQGGTSAYTYGTHLRSGWSGFDGTQANGNIKAVTIAPTTLWYQFSLVPTLVKQVDWFLSLYINSGTWGRL